MLKPCIMTQCIECKYGTRVTKRSVGSTTYCFLGIEHTKKDTCIMFESIFPWEQDLNAKRSQTCIIDKKMHVI